MNYKYVIAYMGQNKLKGLTDEEIIGITGIDNYTPEIVARLVKLFVDGKIESRPVLGSMPNYDASNPAMRRTITWQDEDGKAHRGGDLPAEEIEGTSKTWFNHGIRTRENGPAVIYDDGSVYDVEWFKNGARITQTNANISTDEAAYNDNPEEATKKAIENYISFYVESIKKEFPNASPEWTSEEALDKLRKRYTEEGVDVDDMGHFDYHEQYDVDDVSADDFLTDFHNTTTKS